MKKLDEILNRHLPDAGLCKKGKMLNQLRKERIKADILSIMKEDKEGLLIVDEMQLGLIKAEVPPRPQFKIPSTELRP